MGTLVGHLVPGLALTLAYGTSSAPSKLTVSKALLTSQSGSADFTVRFYFPCDGPFPLLKHLELIFFLFFSIFVIFMQVLDFPFLHFALKLDNLEHATMYLKLFRFFTFCGINSFHRHLIWGSWNICSFCFWSRAFSPPFSLS